MGNAHSNGYINPMAHPLFRLNENAIARLATENIQHKKHRRLLGNLLLKCLNINTIIILYIVIFINSLGRRSLKPKSPFEIPFSSC